jgi:mgtE-like transporter
MVFEEMAVVEELENSKREYKIIKTVLKQAFPILILYTIVELLAGLELSLALPTIAVLPGAIILVPAIMDMRGNIISALGSRLGSAAHLGLLAPPHRKDEIKQNIVGSIGSSMIVGAIAGIVAYYVTISLGFSASLFKFILAAFLAGTLSGISLTAVAIVIALATTFTNLDPDNVVQPTTAALGDILSVFWVVVAIRLVLVI